MRWNIEQRLEFIEFRLFWDGRVNRSDLIEAFNISLPQASADLTRYQEAAGGNMVYDKTAKTYVTGDNFRPIFFKPSADRFLAQLRSVAAGMLDVADTWLDQPPPFAVVPLLRRKVDSDSLQCIIKGIRNRHAVLVEYQSYSSGAIKPRWIAPHSIGFNGFRWHARAWCFSHGQFRDFVLARISKCYETRPSDVKPSSDIEWHTEVTFRLSPNPSLEPSIQRALEIEYGMKDGVIEIKTQVAMSFYVELLLNLDLDPAVLPPKRQQLVLTNRNEVEEIRRVARRTPQ